MTVTLHLEAACGIEPCRTFARKLYDQLREGYGDDASLLEIPEDPSDWLLEHRTARKRAARAHRLGYRFEEIRRHEHELSIFEINTSMPERQGRPMTPSYGKLHEFNDPVPWPCDRHRVYPYGVLDEGGKLRAYLWLYRCGEMAMVSSILGHGDHLSNDVMYLLVAGMVKEQARLGGFGFYNVHSSGTEGLRFFKERCGFYGREARWKL